MTSLRQALIDFPGAQALLSSKPAGNRRTSSDRRANERRNNIYPFESRDNRLRFAAQAAGFGVYDMDCTTGDSVWSPELRQMAGLPPTPGPLTTEQAEALIHPEDRERLTEHLRASLEPNGSGEFEDEYRLLKADGTYRWVRTKGRTFFVGEGDARRPLAATGIVMDITASRLAERKLAESQEELDKMVEAAIDAVITIDQDQRIVRFNPSACRMFGCTAEEAMGSRVERFMPERYRAGHPEKVRRFAEGESPAQSLDSPRRFTGLRANGEEFLFEATVTKVKVDGHARLTTFMRDITDRVAAEERIRHSKEALELAVRGGKIGIWHWDMRTNTLEWSGRQYQLFGVPIGTRPTHESVMARMHPEDREQIEEALKRAMEHDEELDLEHRIVWPDGSVHWLATVGRCQRDGRDGPATGIRGVSMDVTERKRQEEALRRSKEELEVRVEERTRELTRANEALAQGNLELQQFAFIAAHDMQTPLRSISGFAQLLLNDYSDHLEPQAQLWLNQMVRSAHRMRDVIHDILSYSRVESRGHTFRPTDLNYLFEEVTATLDVPMGETKASVTRDELPTVMGDRTQLAQVLQNLIDNALKYCKAEAPRVHVSAHREEAGWTISVRDNGIGIPEKHLDNIFDVFRRLHTQQDYPGTGIGLAICRRVIHRHGGRIWAESHPGEGSTFYFTLPDGHGEA